MNTKPDRPIPGNEAARFYIDSDEAKAMLMAEFARDPLFLDEVGKLVAYGKFSESSTLFDYLFVPTSTKADGANHEVIGFRLRNADERLLARAAFDRESGYVGGHATPLADEIEVTPEMIRAGVREICLFSTAEDELEVIVQAVFSAMVEADRRARPFPKND